ncbi:MAG: hypothetical protein AAF384_19640 [Pseudomonadota bacterium]
MDLGKRLLAILMVWGAGPAYSTALVLDDTNGYSVELEPGVILTRPGLNIGGPLFISGGEFAIDTGSFSGQSQLGGAGFRLSGFRPRDLATGLPIGSGPIPFVVKATASGNVYDATLPFWSGEMLWGSPPLPLEETFPGSGVFVAANAAGAVVDVQPVSNPPTHIIVPIPITTILIGLSMLSFVGARRLAKSI